MVRSSDADEFPWIRVGLGRVSTPPDIGFRREWRKWGLLSNGYVQKPKYSNWLFGICGEDVPLLERVCKACHLSELDVARSFPRIRISFAAHLDTRFSSARSLLQQAPQAIEIDSTSRLLRSDSSLRKCSGTLGKGRGRARQPVGPHRTRTAACRLHFTIIFNMSWDMHTCISGSRRPILFIFGARRSLWMGLYGRTRQTRLRMSLSLSHLVVDPPSQAHFHDRCSSGTWARLGLRECGIERIPSTFRGKFRAANRMSIPIFLVKLHSREFSNHSQAHFHDQCS